MARKREVDRMMVGDFETTVFDGQTRTEVWASALVEIGTEDVTIFHSLDETEEYLVESRENLIIYYHNLKFDGSFWVDWLLHHGYKLAAREVCGDVRWLDPKEMNRKTFTVSIAGLGQWYRIYIKTKYRKVIELRDSLKLLPFAVRTIGKGFRTKHQKLDMEYKGYRYAGCEITDEEKAYIANDVLVVKEALEIMFAQGHTALTIGSCCMQEYKMLIGADTYRQVHPMLYDIVLNSEQYGADNAGTYIRNAYRGGWCYVVAGKEKKLFRNGCTCDVNSLYPSMMHSMSGNEYPIGEPHFWTGPVPDEARQPHRYYYIRVRTRFYIKEGMLPFIQIKRNMLYRSNECLTTSDIWYKGRYWREMLNEITGEIVPTTVTMTLTCTDWQLMQEHYCLEDTEILDGCWFDSMSGMFDEYIDKYKRIKQENKGALRTLAKLFLNNLYGKFATSTDSTFKWPRLEDDGLVHYIIQPEQDKTPGYIAIGAAITSYARNFTIRAAQANYHGPDRPGFIYADTDSIHCDLPKEEIRGIVTHSTEFCCWKVESFWDRGWFVRQKTYAEHITHEDAEPVDAYWSVKCAGMPERCKRLFGMSMTGYEYRQGDDELYTQDELKFLEKKRTIIDFTQGIRVPGKLMPKVIEGGTILTETYFEMR